MADFGPDLGGGGTELFRVTPAGSVSVFATGFNGASGNDFDSQGNLFQSNISASRIDKVAPDGTVTAFTSQNIRGPVGVYVDEGDTLYVCNCASNTIRKVTPSGVSTLFSSGFLFQCPNGITRDDDGNFYVSNFNNGRVLKILPDGTESIFATIPGGNNGHLTYHDGLLYVVARSANQIYTVTLDGVVELFAGSGTQGVVDGSRLQAQFSQPNDVIVDPTGQYLYVNDVVSPTGFNDISPMILRRIDLSAIVGVTPTAERSGSSLHVQGARPNPSRGDTSISFSLDRPAHVRVRIVDVTGRDVRTLLDRELSEGAHDAVWSGRDNAGRPVGAGVYFYRLESPLGNATGRLQVVR
jgi:sugar lactone lactonase YvrE